MKRRATIDGITPEVYPMRIAAVEGDVFCFENMHYSTDMPGTTAQLLHRDKFDVAWLAKKATGLEAEFRWRQTVCRYVVPSHDDDESGDDESSDHE